MGALTNPADAARTLAAIRQLVQDVPGEGMDPNAIHFKRLGVQPPGQMYVEQQDQLQLQITTAVSDVHVNVNARILLANGQIASYGITVPAPTAFTKTTSTTQLCAGFLLGVSVNVTSGTVLRGQAYVVVGLQRFGLSSTNPDTILIADYVTSLSPLGWPGGSIRASTDGPGCLTKLTSPLPALGAQGIVTIPAGTRFRPISGTFELDTSAVTGNRGPGVYFDDGTNAYYLDSGYYSQGANSDVIYWFATGITVNTGANAQRFQIPGNILMPAGHRIRTGNFGFDSGDQLQVITVWGEQWLEV